MQKQKGFNVTVWTTSDLFVTFHSHNGVNSCTLYIVRCIENHKTDWNLSYDRKSNVSQEKHKLEKYLKH